MQNKSNKHRYTAIFISIFLPKLVTMGWNVSEVNAFGFFFFAAGLQLLAVLLGVQAVKEANNQKDKVLGIISTIYAGVWMIPDIVIFVVANLELQAFVWGNNR